VTEPHPAAGALPCAPAGQGLDAFERIGEDVTETVERRPASLVVVRTHKPKFVPKGRDRLAETTVLQASTPELPIERGLAGPGLLADTIVRRWQDHLPLHRLERIYGREGLELARSTICGWHEELSHLVQPLIDEMWADARKAPYLCVDATGVLVQALDKCRHAHFFVVAAPDKHVLFGYSPRHDANAVDRLLDGYTGYLVADAHAVYDHLYKDGRVVESGCWSDARRYFFKALGSDPQRANVALELIKKLFLTERTLATSPPEVRLKVRQVEARPIVDAFFKWCDEQAGCVLSETPIAQAIGYAPNQREALCRFLEDGRLPIHNNFSERQLRREALGRKNWLFVGSDEAGSVNANFVSLLASCELHGIEPLGYLRDLFCLLPSWPRRRVLELAPAYWAKTLEDKDAQQRLATNVFRQASLGTLGEHQPTQ
jgi:transposase